jgi:hypothetical protein
MVASKGLTSPYALKMRPDERELLEEVQRVYGLHGIEMSLNDTIRHLIRRGSIVLAHIPDEAAAQIRKHAAGCGSCDVLANEYKCPEGLFLYRNYIRVCSAHAETQQADAL